MNKRWWAVTAASFIVGGVLIGVGFWLFEAESFLENLIAEGIGLAFALGIVIWLIEGPVLTRERKFHAIVEYKRQVFRVAGEIGNVFVVEIAQAIADDFEPRIDLYGHERGNPEEFKPLLRTVFRRAKEVRQCGLPRDPDLSMEDASSIIESCLSMELRIRQVTDTRPEFAKWEVLRGFDLALHQIRSASERAVRLGLVEDPTERYETVGHMGDLVLNMLDSITPLSEGSELW